MARFPSPSKAPHLYRWIIDGHNLIFSSPRWARLHGTGQGRAARRQLERWIEGFGRATGVQPWIVYDGAESGPQRESPEGPHLRVLYTDPPAEADDQIRLLVAVAVRAGEAVCVVSSDRRTLGDSLPAEARFLSVPAFRQVHESRVRTPEKWLRSEELSDVERHFLASSPFASDRAAAGDEEDPGGSGPNAGDAPDPPRVPDSRDPADPPDPSDPSDPPDPHAPTERPAGPDGPHGVDFEDPR